MRRNDFGTTTGLGLMALLLLAGCTVGPNYKKPEDKAPGTFTNADKAGDAHAVSVTTNEPTDLREWWKTLNDPMLNALVERGIAGSPDLRLALARVQEARAQRGVSESLAYPTLDAAGGYTRSRGSQNAFGRNGAPGQVSNFFDARLDAGWEIDVFGGVRRGVEAADAQLESSEWSRRDVLVTLTSEIARSYVEYRGFQRRLEVLDEAVRVQSETQEVAKARLEAGIVPELDYAQATAVLEARRSQVPVVTTALKQSLHRLGVLLGEMPTSLQEELAAKGAIPMTPPRVPVGLATDLLQRRPDIRRAERDLAAATARIGVVTADLYPKFTLSGTIGLQSDTFNTWGSLASHTWSVGPGVRWNAFDANRIRENIAAADARSRQSLAMYDKTILSAFEEVENRLVAFAQEQSRWNSLKQAVAANQRAVDLSIDLNRAGIRDFLNVLDSQRALYDNEDQLVQSEVSVTTGLIALYKSLGGGWEGQTLMPKNSEELSPERGSADDEMPPFQNTGAGMTSR